MPDWVSNLSAFDEAIYIIIDRYFTNINRLPGHAQTSPAN